MSIHSDIPICSKIHTTILSIHTNTYNKTQYLPILRCNFTDVDGRHLVNENIIILTFFYLCERIVIMKNHKFLGYETIFLYNDSSYDNVFIFPVQWLHMKIGWVIKVMICPISAKIPWQNCRQIMPIKELKLYHAPNFLESAHQCQTDIVLVPVWDVLCSLLASSSETTNSAHLPYMIPVQ